MLNILSKDVLYVITSKRRMRFTLSVHAEMVPKLIIKH